MIMSQSLLDVHPDYFIDEVLELFRANTWKMLLVKDKVSEVLLFMFRDAYLGS